MEAVLVLVGGAVAAAITGGPAWVKLRRDVQQASQHIGTTNGAGSIAQMVEASLVRLGEMQADVRGVRELLEAHTTDMAVHRRGVEAVTWYGQEPLATSDSPRRATAGGKDDD